MTASGNEWTFLGVRVSQLSAADSWVVVSELVLPEGAAPRLHIHDEVDDCFYVIDGTLVVRCGESFSIATTGTWVRLPHSVPHTFRVIDAPARILQVHADDSFLKVVRALGRPTSDDAAVEPEPSDEEVANVMAENGIRMVGSPMEAEEAAVWLQRLREAA